MLNRINTFRWQSITETLLNALKRFPVAATATIGLCISLLLLVNLPYEQVKGSILYEPSYWYVWVGTLPLAASIVLCFENRLNPTIRHSVSLLAVLLWNLYGYISNDTPEHFFGALAFIAPIVTFFSSLFWAAFLKKDTDTSFWNFSYLLCIQILTGLLFASVLAAGLSLALFSTDTLFGCEFKSEMYSNIHVLCYTLFFPFYLLGNIPIASITETKTRSFAQAWKILGLYILLPLLILYGTILYAYLIKIIIQWQLPDGWVSALVSILTIGGTITLFILYPLCIQKNRPLKFFRQWFGILLLPLLILMTVGIIRRFQDYGITTNRLYVLLLNFWCYTTALYTIFTSGKKIKIPFISFILLFLISSIGPWRFSEITRYTMHKRIDTLIQNNKLGTNNLLTFDSLETQCTQLDSIDATRLQDDLLYLTENYGAKDIQVWFTDSVSSMQFSKLTQGITSALNRSQENHRIYFSYYQSDSYEGKNINIKDYQYALFFDENSNIRTNSDNVEILGPDSTVVAVYPLVDLLKKQNYKVNSNDTIWSFRGNNTYILPLSLDGYMNNPKEIGGLYIKGIVFYNP